ncbi:MAG: hypothetical protein ACXQT5_00195 [Candidatus Syntropharchaeia archaeon]
MKDLEIEVYTTSRGNIFITMGRLEVELKREDAERLKTLLELTDWLEGLMKLDREKLEEFGEEMLALVTENRVEMDGREKGLVSYLMKGEYTKTTLRNILEVGMRANPQRTREIANKFTS